LEVVEGLFKTRLLIREDMRHSLSEERFIAMGEVNHRVVFVAYTIRKKGDGNPDSRDQRQICPYRFCGKGFL